MKVLVVNAGSSSIKYQLYEMPQAKVLARGVVEKIGEQGSQLTHKYDGKTHEVKSDIPDHEKGMGVMLDVLTDAEAGVLDDINEIGAVGHRVVHGGEEFTGSVMIDEKVIESIERFADLAPLHNPPNLTGIRAAITKLPGVPQVACFDTAFHASIPKTAWLYALPYELYEKYRIRRYGFHGTSHRYVSSKAAEILKKDKAEINVITCHLGNGCSMAAVRGGKCVDTTMGLTPLEGLVMGTRCGDIDPAILFYLSRKDYDVDSLDKICNKQSGLLGISGKSNDMRDLWSLVEQGDKRAALAVDIFCIRIKKYIGAYTAELGKLDAVIFTGGIGENSFFVRKKVCADLDQIGIKIDEQKNDNLPEPQCEISTADSKVKVFVIPTDEEGIIAGDTFRLTGKG